MPRSNLHYQPHSRVRKAKVRAVRHALQRSGLSRNQFAKLAGVGHDIVYRLLGDGGRDISLGSWEKIERLLMQMEIPYEPQKVKVRKRIN